MSEKLSEIRLLKINDRIIIGKREATITELKKFFEKETGSEIIEAQILLFEERARGTNVTWSEIAAEAEFNLDDLPVFMNERNEF